jgi:hypothetical protein
MDRQCNEFISGYQTGYHGIPDSNQSGLQQEFLYFSFTSYDTVASVLLQKDDDSMDHPVAFFRKTLRDDELRYDPIEKQAYALIKSLKAFRIYILHAKVIAYVPSPSVKDVLT